MKTKYIQKRKAFTLIELIFVIVILGIFATIAITKFNATRIDAKIAVMSGKISTIMSEVSSYAVGHASLEGNVTKFSNIVAEMVNEGIAHIEESQNETNVNIMVDGITDCVKLTLRRGSVEENLILSFPYEGENNVCNGIKSHFVDNNVTLKLRGHFAKF